MPSQVRILYSPPDMTDNRKARLRSSAAEHSLGKGKVTSSILVEGSRFHHFAPSVKPGQLSVRNGDAGSFAPLNRLG